MRQRGRGRRRGFGRMLSLSNTKYPQSTAPPYVLPLQSRHQYQPVSPPLQKKKKEPAGNNKKVKRTREEKRKKGWKPWKTTRVSNALPKKKTLLRFSSLPCKGGQKKKKKQTPSKTSSEREEQEKNDIIQKTETGRDGMSHCPTPPPLSKHLSRHATRHISRPRAHSSRPSHISTTT